jgi:hypothetical protein
MVTCCARAASGQARTAPPRSVMNSRRLTGCPSGSIGCSRVTREETSFESATWGLHTALEHTKQSRERGPDYHSGDEDHRGKRAKIFKASWSARLRRAAQAISLSFAYASHPIHLWAAARVYPYRRRRPPSPSMMQDRERSRARDSTINGKRQVRSLPGRL